MEKREYLCSASTIRSIRNIPVINPTLTLFQDDVRHRGDAVSSQSGFKFHRKTALDCEAEKDPGTSARFLIL